MCQPNCTGMVCGDDRDCGGTCEVNTEAKRAYTFQWDASLVYNRGDPRWFAFMLGKGTGRRYLTFEKVAHNKTAEELLELLQTDSDRK